MTFASVPASPDCFSLGGTLLMARPVIKFANVNSKRLRQLHEVYQSHRLASHRRRAHAMILSSQGYSPAEVAEILEADADTVRRWIDRFNQQGCAACGRKEACSGERQFLSESTNARLSKT